MVSFDSELVGVVSHSGEDRVVSIAVGEVAGA